MTWVEFADRHIVAIVFIVLLVTDALGKFIQALFLVSRRRRRGDDSD